MKVYIFVDDERIEMFNKIESEITNTDICLYWCKTYKSAIKTINFHTQMNDSIFLDLDHDLGEKRSGYDIAKYIVKNHISLYGFRCHSFNSVGRKNIEDLLIHYGYKMR